ncbi:hypothetical protein DOY81_013355, partial [Sarcophaga bullata]
LDLIEIVNMKSAVCVLLLINVVFSVPEQKWRESEDGSKFFIETDKKYTWFQAWNNCARKNMSLIAIDTYEKHQQFDKLLRKYYNKLTYIWIGGHNYDNSLQYQWASTGEVFTFTNWHPNEPDARQNTCVRLDVDYQWYNSDCFNKFGYICEENQANKKTCDDKGKNELRTNVFYFNNIENSK